jgi:hypothetical protein
MTYGPFSSEVATAAGALNSSIIQLIVSGLEMISLRLANLTIPACDSITQNTPQGGSKLVHKAQLQIDDFVANTAKKSCMLTQLNSYLSSLPHYFLRCSVKWRCLADAIDLLASNDVSYQKGFLTLEYVCFNYKPSLVLMRLQDALVCK